MILLATALTTVPQDIYESASIDGATRIQRFFLYYSASFEAGHHIGAYAGIHLYL